MRLIDENCSSRVENVPAEPLGGIDANQPFDDRVRDLLLAALYSAPSILALIPFQDAMGTRERINVPGTLRKENWRYRLPWTIDELLADEANMTRLRDLATNAGRLEGAAEAVPAR